MSDYEFETPKTEYPYEYAAAEPFETNPEEYPHPEYDTKSARKIFSKVAWALVTIFIASIAAQILWGILIEVIFGEDHWLLTSSWGMWINSYLPFYAIAIPCGLLVFRKIPTHAPQKKKLTLKDFVIFFLIGYFFTYAGNLIGNLTSMIFSGGTAENGVVELAMDNTPLKFLVIVILAPIFEEYIFRKKLIDCTRIYGEKTSVFLSGLTFGLFHMNLFQFFYAFGLGLIFGYIYVRTGKIRYTIAMHAIVNFLGSVLAPLILSLFDPNALSQETTLDLARLIAQDPDTLIGILIYTLYFFLLLGISIAGLVLFCIYCNKIVWEKTSLELPKEKRFRTIYFNAGMIVYIILCAAMMIFALG